MKEVIKLEAVTPAEETFLIGNIQQTMAALPATGGQGRSRIDRFGWDYAKPQNWVANIPGWALPEFANWSDAVTLNEYRPGTGITPHIDSRAFGEPIYILSLGSCATMRFTLDRQKPLKLFLPPRSLMMLSGPLRYDWKHEITAERNDTDGTGVRHARQTRWSIVWRKKV